MRTKVIPAQITTVEDKIAGNLNLTQILILMTPVFLSTFVYALLPPNMHLTGYKVVLVLVLGLISIVLSLRIKGKVVANWIVVLLRFNLRPKYYIYNKNTGLMRKTYALKPKKVPLALKKEVEEKIHAPKAKVSIQDAIKLDHFITKEKIGLKYKTAKKGGLNVAFEQIVK